MKYYKVITYGCQMNEHESEKLCGIIENKGYTKIEDENLCDLIVFNTCCIRENAEQRACGNIGALKRLKKAKKGLIIAVGGCMTQQKGKAESLKNKFPFIDIIFGTHNLVDFGEMLDKRIKTDKKLIDISNDETSVRECAYVSRSKYPSALVNVMYGCNNYCSYCIVPYVRGRERSRDVNDIYNEVKHLVENGYKEITLLGQNVDSYGKDLPSGIDFSDLLSKICTIDGKYRIRFMSNHPKDVNEKLALTIKNNDKICNNIHFPIQSGSNRVLELMNRRYTRENCIQKIKMLRDIVPNITITTDIMVGFPMESDEDFNDTLDIVRTVEFDGAFTFVYSVREGTKASKMSGHIDEDVKKSRIIELVDLQNAINRKKSSEFVGKTLEVLCEGYDADKNIYFGRDEGGKMLNFTADSDVFDKFVMVKITKANGITLFGEVVK